MTVGSLGSASCDARFPLVHLFPCGRHRCVRALLGVRTLHSRRYQYLQGRMSVARHSDRCVTKTCLPRPGWQPRAARRQRLLASYDPHTHTRGGHALYLCTPSRNGRASSVPHPLICFAAGERCFANAVLAAASAAAAIVVHSSCLASPHSMRCRSSAITLTCDAPYGERGGAPTDMENHFDDVRTSKPVDKRGGWTRTRLSSAGSHRRRLGMKLQDRPASWPVDRLAWLGVHSSSSAVRAELDTHQTM